MSKKIKRLIVRMNEKELNDVKLKSNLYFNGNVSKWVRYCLLNYIPSMPKKKPKL